jgi:hypothetical protein
MHSNLSEPFRKKKFASALAMLGCTRIVAETIGALECKPAVLQRTVAGLVFLAIFGAYAN